MLHHYRVHPGQLEPHLDDVLAEVRQGDHDAAEDIRQIVRPVIAPYRGRPPDQGRLRTPLRKLRKVQDVIPHLQQGSAVGLELSPRRDHSLPRLVHHLLENDLCCVNLDAKCRNGRGDFRLHLHRVRNRCCHSPGSSVPLIKIYSLFIKFCFTLL